MSELDDFKRKVVKVARKATAEFGWCGEVNSILRDDLGLGAFLPAEYVVECLEDKDEDWYVEESEYTNLRDAKATAKAYDNNKHNGREQSEYVGYVNYQSVNRLKDIIKRFESREKPEYPKFRVVKVTDKREVVYTP